MSEVYKVLNGCVLVPPSSNPTTEIDMPVVTVNAAPTPVYQIRAFPPSGTSYERETTQAANRYADIYFTAAQFSTLKTNANVHTVYVSYDAPAIPGADDRIYNQTVLTHYP